MTWVVQTKPHYHVRFRCGHTQRCACILHAGNQRGLFRLKTIHAQSEELCPACR